MPRTTATVSFQAIELKGSLLPGSLLEQVARLQAPMQKEADYGLAKGERLRERIDAAWVRLKEIWEEHKDLRNRAAQGISGLHTSVRILREVLGWPDLQPSSGWQHGDAHFPITHRAFEGAVPLILRGIAADQLDKGSSQFGQEGRRRSPHSCLQECLNADDNAKWGLLLTGDRLRLQHDNPSLVKPAYLAVDLELLVEGELFDEFAVLWLLLHASRFRHPQTGSCVLDTWKEQAQEAGERVLGQLRNGVQQALEALGNGLLQHPDNDALRHQLASGALSGQELHRQLLRLVYRFLFLFTAEDRDLLFPRTLGQEDPRRRIYREGYSVGRLRELAIRRSASEGPYGDLWQTQKLVFLQLRQSSSPLGLPGLGGLFAEPQCRALEECELANRFLLRAIRAIGWFQAGDTLTRVNYRDLNTEELGSVYEGLLELHPQLERAGGSWQLSYGGGAGSDRKTTGSYYTPDQLVQLLIVSALLPVIADRLAKASTPEEKEQALLAIRVLDPACGSGHFLLAAARRLALELARIRAGDEEPSEELRQECLREVVAHCIYGVDKNPMAVELCKVALWIEAVDPGKPLSFLDAHIQCGDSLVGVFDPKVLEQGIPDEAYKPLTGDDKPTCTSLKKENASFRKAGQKGTLQGTLNLQTSPPINRSQQQLQEIEAMPETTLAEGAAKQAAYESWEQERSSDPQTLAADLYTAAFFLPKTQASRSKVPTSEHLLLLQSGQEIPGDLELAVEQAAKDFRFFHWHLRFGEVMKRGGFDCVLGNPPWETMSPNVKQWFSTYDAGIKFATPQEQDQIKEHLLKNELISWLWNRHCTQLSSASEHIKNSKRFRLFAPGNLGKGNMNMYRFFVETGIALTANDKCSIGLIVPDHLYLGTSSFAIRRSLIEERGDLRLLCFENKSECWFQGIDSRAKFCLLTSISSPRSLDIYAEFGITSLDDLRTRNIQKALPGWLIKEVGGEAEAIPELRSTYDIEVLEALYKAYPNFRNAYESAGIDRPYSQELNMGTNNTLFSQEATEQIPVFEGRMIDHYDYTAKKYVSGHGRAAVWESLPFDHCKRIIKPQWYIKPDLLSDDRKLRIQSTRIGFCDVASPTNQRTLVCSLIPSMCICGDKVPTINLGAISVRSQLLTLAIANTLTMDFLARKKVSLKMSFSVFDSLPVPLKTELSETEVEVSRRSASLAFAGDELAHMAASYQKEDQGWSGFVSRSESERAVLKSEIEVIYAGSILGLSKEAIAFILDPMSVNPSLSDYETFGALKRAEIRQFGEYRTQRLVLEAWDRLFGG